MTKQSTCLLVVPLILGASFAGACDSVDDPDLHGGASTGTSSGNTGGTSNTTSGAQMGTSGNSTTGNAGGSENTGGSDNTGGSGNTAGSSNAGGAGNTAGSGSGGRAGSGAMTDARVDSTTKDAPNTVMPDASVPSDSGASTSPSVGGCGIFPANDPWNQVIPANAQIDATWTTKLIGNALKTVLHPDFGTTFGIPFNVVPAAQAKLPITFDYADDSDPGPYPFPGATAKIEGGSPSACTGDCHVLSILQGTCALYEAWNCHYNAGGNSWQCGSGAKFDLTKVSPGQRPKGWTSADAAGLAILPGLVRYDEVAAGAIKHAIRFTMHCVQDGFVTPASHQAVSTGPNNCPVGIATATLRAEYPPMGLRIRLKAGYAIDALPAQAKIVAQAMKTYGMILADNGSDYFFQGDPNPGWNDGQINALKAIPGDQFEVIVPGTIER